MQVLLSHVCHLFLSSLMQVRAKLAMLNKQWPVAENLLLSQGKIDECIAMYQDIHKCVCLCLCVLYVCLHIVCQLRG